MILAILLRGDSTQVLLLCGQCGYFGESDIDPALGDAMRFLSEPEDPVDLSSNPQGQISASISPPLDSRGLSALPQKLSDARQLPLSPESCQSSSKRKLSAVESQSDQYSRNLRPRLALTESSCQSDDTCENACKSSPFSQNSNTRHSKNSHAKSEASPSKTSGCEPTRDRWNGRFSCHVVLSGLSSAAKYSLGIG